MLVLLLAVLLLVVSPALLLWMGRKIESFTDGRNRVAPAKDMATTDAASARDGGEWYRRPMQPAFKAPLWSRKG